MRLIPGGLRCSGVLVDVKRGDVTVKVLLYPLGEVFKPMLLLWVFPCLPHRAQLNYDVHWREDMLGQREEALKEGSGLGPGCHASDGAFAQQGAHGVGVDAEPKNPCLGAHVVGGRGGIQRH